jgi:hypothetical protein
MPLKNYFWEILKQSYTGVVQSQICSITKQPIYLSREIT